MQIALLSIGDELLHGVRLNTHALFIGQKLLELGCFLNEVLTLPDEAPPLIDAFQRMTAHYDVLIITGGLGPTKDDLTREALCAFLGKECQLDAQQAQALEKRWKARYLALPYPSENKKQAMVIQGTTKIENPTGAALGMQLKHQKCELFVLPGPPNEMQPMFENSVLPFIRAKNETLKQVEKMMIYGVGESVLAHKIEQLKREDIQINYCVCFDGVEVFISGEKMTAVEAQKKLILNAFKDHVLPQHSLVESLVSLLRKTNQTLGVAESCTGGLFAHLITQLPGVSDIFSGGIVSYQNNVKITLLNVQKSTLQTEGAVSEKCCHEMVAGIMKMLNTSCGVAITGIAGPTGGSVEKPLGTVYIGIGIHDHITVEKLQLSGDRIQIQSQSVAKAMYNLIIKIKNRS